MLPTNTTNASKQAPTASVENLMVLRFRSEDIKVVKINVDEEQELAAQFQIMSIPCLMVMKNGQIVNQAVGARPKNQILDML